MKSIINNIIDIVFITSAFFIQPTQHQTNGDKITFNNSDDSIIGG
jgi:hypothetical protein